MNNSQLLKDEGVENMPFKILDIYVCTTLDNKSKFIVKRRYFTLDELYKIDKLCVIKMYDLIEEKYYYKLYYKNNPIFISKFYPNDFRLGTEQDISIIFDINIDKKKYSNETINKINVLDKAEYIVIYDYYNQYKTIDEQIINFKKENNILSIQFDNDTIYSSE